MIGPVITPLVTAALAVLTLLSAPYSPAGPTAEQPAPGVVRAGQQLGAAALTPAPGRASSRAVAAGVRSVAFSTPLPATTTAAAAGPMTCPGSPSGDNNSSGYGNSADDSAIRIDIQVERADSGEGYYSRGQGSAARGGTGGRRGPLVIGCGPDGQVVVLACAANPTNRDPGQGSRGHRGSNRLGGLGRGNAERSDVNPDDLNLADLIDLSDALGINVRDLIELAGRQGRSRAGGGIQIGDHNGRGGLGSVNPWARHTNSLNDTDTSLDGLDTDNDLDSSLDSGVDSLSDGDTNQLGRLARLLRDSTGQGGSGRTQGCRWLSR